MIYYTSTFLFFLPIIYVLEHLNFQKNIFSCKLIRKTRYGENPHQKAAIYSKNNFQDINQLGGKDLSYNNYNDLYSALSITQFLPKNKGVAIIKHANAVAKIVAV